MTMRFITEIEILQRQQEVRNGARRARTSFSVAGIRQLIGNTFIAMGTRMNGQDTSRRTPNRQTATVPAHGA